MLLGRSPEPTVEPEWLERLTAEADIKKEIASRAGAGASPRHVGEEYARLMANREIRQTLTNVAKTMRQGGHVEYRAVDVRRSRAAISTAPSPAAAPGAARRSRPPAAPATLAPWRGCTRPWPAAAVSTVCATEFQS